MIKQEGDEFITDAAIRLNLPIEQRVNKVHIYLQLLLVSDLPIYKKNIIKYSLRDSLVDESYISKLKLLSSAPCKKDIYY